MATLSELVCTILLAFRQAAFIKIICFDNDTLAADGYAVLGMSRWVCDDGMSHWVCRVGNVAMGM